jgi:heat shock protein HspQ
MIEPNIPRNDEAPPTPEQGPDWLKIARDAFSGSTSYMDANWRKQWEDNIAMFQSRHPAGSKYNSDAYKSRSRLFRPKTRSVVRKNEAAVAVAFFSNPDVVTLEAEDDTSPEQLVSAEIWKHVVNYRLQKTIPWFHLLVGGAQTAQVIGIVCSYQYWHYKEKVHVTQEPITDDMGNQLMDDQGPVMQEFEQIEVIKDEPCIELLPAEQFRFDPGADWLNVVESSPYFIRLVPKYVCDVRELMEAQDRKTGQPKWKKYSDAEIRMAIADHDTLRQARENKREDPLANNDAPISDFEIVWCHENFVRIGSEEKVYWTLGAQKLLTDPQDLKDVYFTGKRPFVIGSCVIEANKAVPDSLVQMGSSLQRETNDTVNQRRDNVSLVLNKRFIVKRGRDVDVQSLVRNVSGGVTMATDTEDVKTLEWNDVTASSYQEQDRLNVDFDELTGNFSSSSVMTNRKLNETVGGMQMLGQGANQLTEYMIRTLVETWVEPVLRQLVKLEQAYETDQTVLGLAGKKAQETLQRYGVNEITDELLNQELTVRVNVGMGATDPQTKLQKFTHAMQTYSGIMTNMPDVDPEALRKELFGLAGYKDGSRFFKKGQDPKDAQMQQLQQALQQMQGELQRMKTEKTAQSIQQLADADLKQAQVVKTLTEAGMIPSQAMAQRAVEPEGV